MPRIAPAEALVDAPVEALVSAMSNARRRWRLRHLAVGAERRRQRVADMQKRQRRRALRLARHLVHRVGRDGDDLGARRRKLPGGFRHQLAGLLPTAFGLQPRDRSKID